MNIIYKNVPFILQQKHCSRLYNKNYMHIYRSSIYNKQQTELLISKDNSLNILKYNFTSTTTVENDSRLGNIGIFKKFMKHFGLADDSKTRMKVASYLLYESVADTLNYAEFFKRFELPNTFNSWFLITELHVWMLLVRAMAEGAEKNEDGRFIRNNIVEAMWADVNIRAKKLCMSNPSAVRLQITDLSQQFQAALITYDEGITDNDKVLAGALWRRFFQRDCDNYEDLELLVKYIRKQMPLLDSLSRYDFSVKPIIKWIPLSEL